MVRLDQVAKLLLGQFDTHEPGKERLPGGMMFHENSEEWNGGAHGRLDIQKDEARRFGSDCQREVLLEPHADDGP